MTMPYERTRALMHTKELLEELQDSSVHPEITADTRRHVTHCLRHFPTVLDLNLLARADPDSYSKVGATWDTPDDEDPCEVDIPKLRPPEGFATWLDYAIEYMETRTLYLDMCVFGGSDISREDMKAAVEQELRDLRLAAGVPDTYQQNRTK